LLLVIEWEACPWQGIATKGFSAPYCTPGLIGETSASRACIEKEKLTTKAALPDLFWADHGEPLLGFADGSIGPTAFAVSAALDIP
jgi:hypothetical protein